MNLDAMNTEELMRFASETKAHPVKFARVNFPSKLGAVAAARDLAAYAVNRACLLESTGKNVRDEEHYKAVCANIRQNFLPDYALPYLGAV
jgi:hypothetical protein